MAKPWAEVASSDQFKALAPEQQEQARAQYFDQVVAPQVPKDQIDVARAQFDQQTALKTDGGGTGSELVRQLGLTARDAINGITGLPAMVGDALNAGVNAGIRGVNDVAGTNIPQIKSASGALNDIENRVGLPQPQTGTERVVNDIATAMAGAGGQSAAAKQIADVLANPRAVSLLRDIAANPSQQIAAAAGGAGGAGAARESGASPIVQAAAGLAGGMAPSAAAAAGAAATRYLLRGGDQNIPAMQQTIRAFHEAGTEPSAGQASGNRLAQATESMLSKYPGGAGVMAGKAENQASEIGAKAEKLADDLSPNASPSVAGRTIEKGLSGPGGFVDRFKQGQKALYDKLDEYIKPQTPVNVSKTAQVLANMNESIDGAEALSKFFKNAKIQDIENALKSDTAGTGAGVMIIPPNATTAEQRAVASHGLLKNRPSVFREGQSTLGEPIAPRRNPYSGKIMNEGGRRAGAAPIVEVKPNTAAPSGYGPGRRVGIPGGSPTNQLPYEAIKKLRTLVGDEISNHSLASDVPRSKWKALYAALSDDLDGAAKTTGNPDAVKAMNRANQFSRAGYARIGDVLDKVARQDIPEKVFKSAVNPADMQAGATKIQGIMKSLTDGERDVVKSAFIRRMGLASAGQQGAEGDTFSSQTFLTNWNKMSPQAKDVMFSSKDGNLRKSLDQIAKTADRIKEGSKVFSNPSGTAPALANLGLITAAGSAAASGNLTTAAGLIGSAGVANLSARLMTNPRFVGWLARATQIKNPETAVQAVQALGKTMQGEPDDVQQDAERYAGAVLAK